jgi:hypothetical protein
VEAVARVLDRSRDHWQKMDDITVHRTTGAGSISYKGDRDAGISYFEPIRRAPQSRGPAVDARLGRELIIKVASDLKDIAESERHARAAVLQSAAPAKREIKSRRRRSESTPAKTRKRK